MERNLGTIGERQFSLCFFGEQVFDQFATTRRIRAATDERNGVRNQQQSRFALSLIRIDDLKRLALPDPGNRVVAIDQSEFKFARGNQVRALTITRGLLDVVRFE